MIPNDTSSEFLEVQLAILRSKSPSERIMIAARLSGEMIRASKQAISRVHPDYSSVQIEDAFIELHHGRDLANAVREYRSNMGA